MNRIEKNRKNRERLFPIPPHLRNVRSLPTLRRKEFTFFMFCMLALQCIALGVIFYFAFRFMLGDF